MEDNSKRQDLFAIYENLNDSFLDLTFREFAVSQTSPHACNKTQLANSILHKLPSFDFSNGLATVGNPHPLSTLLEDNQEVNLNEEAKLNENLTQGNDAKIDEFSTIIKGISANQELKNLKDVNDDKEIKVKRGIKSPSSKHTGKKLHAKENGLTSFFKRKFSLNESASKNSRSTSMGDVLGDKIKNPCHVKHALHGDHAYGNHKQFVASNDVMKYMRSPPPSKHIPRPRSNHCSFCSKFIFFFRIRCSDCKRLFCSKCAKKCVSEGKKCKGCSLGHSHCRRSKEKHGQKGAFYGMKEITEPPSSKRQKQNVAPKHGGKQSPKVQGAHVVNSRRKEFPRNPSSSPRRHSNYVASTGQFTRTPPISPRRHSNYVAPTSQYTRTPPVSPRRNSFYRY